VEHFLVTGSVFSEIPELSKRTGACFFQGYAKRVSEYGCLSTALSTIFICPISSDVQERLPLRPIIEAEPSTGLRLRSQIMTDKMIALRRDRVRSVIGDIDMETSEHLDRALLVVLGLAR
jgi:mRNA interferase MazF